ncbi:dihydrodipicolinate synthase family protein [Luminiphilus syltensis]|uniref:dihydrodipicolinate synthase family protein n=1 Tax=Luminiphilus syltensis TaxID=1341119 RepID=UPI0003048E1C|nr:dihydrodipicolinate synthase family protein [Luminiphilus syltensis]
MDRDSIDWRGYIPALTTPFDEAGELDAAGVKSLHRWVQGNGVHGFIVLGTQGEWFNMTTAERKTLMRLAAEEMAGKLTLIAGCSDYRAHDVLANITEAANCGFDGALVTPPPYMKPTEREIYSFYQEVSAGSALPICVYNWPPGTNIDMSQPLLSELANLERVVAIKNSTPDLGHFFNVLSTVGDRVRVFGAPMNELGISLVTRHGCAGTMGAGNVLGSDQPDFYNAIWQGDYEKAKEFGEKDAYLMRAWFNPDYTGRFGSAQAIFKEALNQQGLPGGFPRRPLLPLEDPGKSAIKKTLEQLGKLTP